MEQKQVMRLTAIKARISDLTNGKFFYGSKEEMKPSYVITPFGERISRVNLIGTVVEKFISEDGSFSSITIDDGTDAIRVKTFGEPVFAGLQLGDLVRAIGKLKEYNGEMYVNYEAVKKETDPNFEILQMMEILQNLVKQKKIVDNVKVLADQMDENELRDYVKETYSLDEEILSVILESKKKDVDYKPMVLDIIKKLDEGNGVQVSKLFEAISLPENTTEKTLNELINEGAVYEPKVGFLKKV